VTNLVIKPRFDRLVNQEIAGTLATANDDPILASIHFSVDDDARWHRAWTTTLPVHRCDRRAGIDARPADLRGWGIRSVLRRTYSPRT
jgi:Methane/Phenol/Toluene Hydroxylase